MIKTPFSARIDMVKSLLPLELQHPSVLTLIQLALEEDLTSGIDLGITGEPITDRDITTRATIPADSRFSGFMRAKANGVVAGIPVAAVVFQVIDPTITIRSSIMDGGVVEKGQILAEIQGRGQSLLVGERTASTFCTGSGSLRHPPVVEAVRGQKR
jgi:nicotinate-nucleotide pyrophosphorylase